MSKREKLVEVMARAHIENICKNVPARLRIPYDAMDSDDQDALKENIRAQLAALEAAGVRLVPVEATADMLNAAFDAADGHFRIDGDAGPWLTCDGHNAAFNAALAASPYAKDNGNG